MSSPSDPVLSKPLPGNFLCETVRAGSNAPVDTGRITTSRGVPARAAGGTVGSTASARSRLPRASPPLAVEIPRAPPTHDREFGSSSPLPGKSIAFLLLPFDGICAALSRESNGLSSISGSSQSLAIHCRRATDRTCAGWSTASGPAAGSPRRSRTVDRDWVRLSLGYRDRFIAQVVEGGQGAPTDEAAGPLRHHGREACD
jgi:hypothetical protein